MKKTKSIIVMCGLLVAATIAVAMNVGKADVLCALAYSGGTGVESDPYLVSSQADWDELATKVTSSDEDASQEGIFFKLTQDITVSQGIGTGGTDHPFAGTFDGDGHSITLDKSKMGNAAGLFGVNKGTIKNLTRRGKTSASSSAGGIAGSNSGVIDNCINYGTVAISGSYAGGICGTTSKDAAATVTNCKNYGNVFTIGTLEDSSKSQPTFYKSNGSSIGGIIGFMNSGYVTTVKGNDNYGEVNGHSNFGGIVGYAKGFSATKNFTIEDCRNFGTVTPYEGDGTGTYAYSKLSNTTKNYVGNIGGIIGFLSSYNTVKNCSNYGDIKGHGGETSGYWRGVGGIVGGMYKSVSPSITRCKNFGDVTSDLTLAGGIAGYGMTGPCDITYCFSVGTISAVQHYAGGILGAGSNFNIKNCESGAIMNCPESKGQIRGSGTATDTDNTTYTISESATTVLRVVDPFECSDVDTTEKKSKMHTTLSTALATLTGDDDNTILNKTWKTSTYRNTADYIVRYCEAGLPSFSLFGANKAVSNDTIAVAGIVCLVTAIACICLLVVKKRKHN